MAIRFEPLTRRHNGTTFASGVGALDEWFRTRATQDQRRHVAQVFVALDEQGLVGFYSLSMFTLAFESLPDQLAHKLPRYEAIRAALIGRLARRERVKGSGIGDLLIADAVTRASRGRVRRRLRNRRGREGRARPAILRLARL